MEATLKRRLEALKYRTTLYELVIEKDGKRYLAGYCRKGRNGLFGMLAKNAEKIAALFGDTVTFAKRASDGAYINGWHVHFTGRTERECIIEGELPFVCDIDAA